MAEMGWTLEEFDEQPFPLTLELLDHFDARYGGKKKKRSQNPEQDEVLKKAGMAPDKTNTAASELDLPDWVRELRQIDRANKMASEIKAKQNG